MSLIITDSHLTNICATCGTRYAKEKTAVDTCLICNDERQYIGDEGQVWTSYDAIAKNRGIRFSQLQKNLYDLRLFPNFAIGQKAHFVVSPGGNILWDCLPFVDEQAVSFIESKGGLKAITISHPHYYSLMVEWARIFDCTIYLHNNDSQWIMHPDDSIETFEGNEKILWDGIKIVHVGGHFAGSTVLLLPHHGNDGTLLTGDSIYVCRDRKQLSFMYSYPNMLPLPKRDIEYINQQVKNLPFDEIHGAFEWMNIPTNAKEKFNYSVKRYLEIYK